MLPLRSPGGPHPDVRTGGGGRGSLRSCMGNPSGPLVSSRCWDRRPSEDASGEGRSTSGFRCRFQSRPLVLGAPPGGCCPAACPAEGPGSGSSALPRLRAPLPPPPLQQPPGNPSSGVGGWEHWVSLLGFPTKLRAGVGVQYWEIAMKPQERWKRRGRWAQRPSPAPPCTWWVHPLGGSVSSFSALGDGGSLPVSAEGAVVRQALAPGEDPQGTHPGPLNS